MCISWGRKETSLGWAFSMSFYRFCHGINLLKLNWRVESWNYKSWWRVHHQGKNSVTLYIANFLSLSPLHPISQKIILPLPSRCAQSHQLSSPVWLYLWSMYHLLSPGSKEPATWYLCFHERGMQVLLAHSPEQNPPTCPHILLRIKG